MGYLASLLVLGALLAPSSAAALGLPILDEVVETVDQVVEEVVESTNEGVETVEGTVKDTTEPVLNTVEQTLGAASGPAAPQEAAAETPRW